jgi:hypothetical protein
MHSESVFIRRCSISANVATQASLGQRLRSRSKNRIRAESSCHDVHEQNHSLDRWPWTGNCATDASNSSRAVLGMSRPT